MINEKLQKLGLSEKEAVVYLAMLKLGVSTASKIAKESGVRRATTYMVLDSLEEKGLAAKVEKEKILYYYPEEPEKFTQKIIAEEKVLQEKFSIIGKIMPDLKNLYKTAQMPPKFKVRQGKEAVEKISADINKSKIDIFYNMVPLNDFWTPFLKEKERQKKLLLKIQNIKLLLGLGKNKVKLYKSKNFEVRYIPLEKYPFESEIVIYGNILGTLNPGKEVLSFNVENQEVAETFKSVFMSIWDNAKPYNF